MCTESAMACEVKLDTTGQVSDCFQIFRDELHTKFTLKHNLAIMIKLQITKVIDFKVLLQKLYKFATKVAQWLLLP